MTEYSRSVNDWSDKEWDHVSIPIMEEHFRNDKEAIQEAKDMNIDIEDFADEKARESYPSMLYCYPLQHEPSEDEIKKVCLNTALSVVLNTSENTYYLALCGGGMDFSQDVALAYLIAENRIPSALAVEVSTQHGLTRSGKDFIRVMKGCKEAIQNEMVRGKNRIKEIDEAIKKVS